MRKCLRLSVRSAMHARGSSKLAIVTACQLRLFPIDRNMLEVLTGSSMYSTCVRIVMVHSAEDSEIRMATLNPLQSNDGSVM